MKFVDITGHTFAHWRVNSRGEDNQYGHPQWNCRCTNCGFDRVILSSELKRKPPFCDCNRPPVYKDLVGQAFGRWVVKSFAGLTADKKALWDVECSCPNQTRSTRSTSELKSQKFQSCGCLKAELWQARITTHGMSKTPTYKAWSGMMKRCTNPNCKDYKYYGGRGITVDPRWLMFENFLEDMGEKPGSEYSLDRERNAEGYSKANCRWVTQEIQQRNKRSVHLITHNGETKTIPEWAALTGIHQITIHMRLYRGWNEVRAITEPPIPLIKSSDKHR